MGIHATLTLSQGYSLWRPQSEPTTSPDAVTNGGGGVGMRRASNRLRGGGGLLVGEGATCRTGGSGPVIAALHGFEPGIGTVLACRARQLDWPP